MNEPCDTHERVFMSLCLSSTPKAAHTWMSHITHMIEPCDTHEWAMSHTWTSLVLVSFMDTFQTQRHDSFMCVTWLIHVCDMIHSCVWYDSFIYLPWLIHVCDVTYSCVWHDSFMCVTWLLHSDDSSMWVSWLTAQHVCDMTHSCAWHDSFMCVTWLLHADNSSMG